MSICSAAELAGEKTVWISELQKRPVLRVHTRVKFLFCLHRVSVEKFVLPPIRTEICGFKLRADIKTHSPQEFGLEPGTCLFIMVFFPSVSLCGY